VLAVRGCAHTERLRARDGGARVAERGHLVGVVREQAQRRAYAEQSHDCADLAVGALVRRHAEPLVRLERRERRGARLDEHAVERLRDEARATPLLHEIEEDAAAARRDVASAPSSCSAQSQSHAPNASLVTHDECTRAGSGAVPPTSPNVTASAVAPDVQLWKRCTTKPPCRVASGSAPSATSVPSRPSVTAALPDRASGPSSP
jgi:hypothetical protein